MALFIGYLIYSLVVGSALDYFSLTGTSTIEGVTLTFASIPPLLFSLMGEELIKLIPFLFFLRLFFKFSNNRKLSIVAAMILVMVFFAMLHLMDLKSLPSVLLIQGLGSIFEFYGYIKTKNVFVSYITHLLTDVFIFTLVIVGMA